MSQDLSRVAGIEGGLRRGGYRPGRKAYPAQRELRRDSHQQQGDLHHAIYPAQRELRGAADAARARPGRKAYPAEREFGV